MIQLKPKPNMKEAKPMKAKNKPTILHTREAMEAEVSDYARLQLHHVALIAAMEVDKAAVEQRYQARLTALALEMEGRFAAIQNYCVLHRHELLPGARKSFETLSATVKFYDTPPRVEKRSRETFGAIARRLLGLVFNAGQAGEMACEKYVREPEPELNKEALLADRKHFTDAQLQAMGIRFESSEVFSIEPKSDVAQAQSAVVEIEQRCAA
jgi:phage host-nuclease inhibitor protein Gam